MIGKNIETKEAQRTRTSNQAFLHDQVLVLQDETGIQLHPYIVGQGTADPIEGNIGQSIGDELDVRNVTFKMFVENAFSLPLVYYRLVFINCSIGRIHGAHTLHTQLSNPMSQHNVEKLRLDETNKEAAAAPLEAQVTVIIKNSQCGIPRNRRLHRKRR
jgi:hypothetical protein